MILVDLDAADDVDLSHVIERWGQTIRHAVLSESARTRMVHGVVLPLSAVQVVEAMRVASEVLARG